MITGSCLCGRVKYEARGEPLFCVVCHCRDCQKASGGGHMPVVGVRKADFSMTGEARVFGVRAFCPHCGSMLLGLPQSAPDLVTLYAGALDDPCPAFEPEYVQFTRHRRDWDKVAFGCKQHPLAGQ